MYISLEGSCANGYKKLSDLHQPEAEKPTIGKDVRAGAGDGVVAADPDLDDTGILHPLSGHIAHRSYRVFGYALKQYPCVGGLSGGTRFLHSVAITAAGIAGAALLFRQASVTARTSRRRYHRR